MKKLMSIWLLLFSAATSATASDFRQFEEHLKYLTQRDKIISKNISNGDTPNYRPVDITKSRDEIGNFSLKKTNPNHIEVNSDTEYELVMAPVEEIKPNGNAVTLETELFKKSENSLRLQETVNSYNKLKAMMKTSIVGAK